MKNTLVKKTTLLPQQIGWRAPRPGEVGPQPILLCQGGAEDDAGDDSDESADDADDDEDAGDDDADTKPAKKPKGKPPTQEEFDRQARHLSNADRKKTEALARAAELEKELNALKTKDLPEAERVRAEHEAVVAERDSFKTKFEKLARTNAFLLATNDQKIVWANATSALRVGDLDDLEIEADGTVPGMADAVKQLAKDHAYLLAPKDSTEEDEKKVTPKSGSVVGGKSKGRKTEEEISREKLLSTYPALNR